MRSICYIDLSKSGIFHFTALRHKRSLACICLFILTIVGLWADNDAFSAEDDAANSQGGIIISRYLVASQADMSKGRPLEVEIEASVPRLNQHGKLRALRKISEVGKITYRVLGFQGDNSVKKEVIARYLQAEQQGQDDKSLTLTPANYKFKLKGEKITSPGQDVYVFQVSPRHKRVGLFKGEVWLDTKTCLPVLEKGRFVKNPSVFFRKVDFERDFAILNGSAVPAHMNSIIDTRLVGKVNLSIAYLSPKANEAGSEDDADVSANPDLY